MQFSKYDMACINRAKDFIDADKGRHHYISEIAAHAGIARTRLKAGFKKIFGMGLYHYLQEQRLQKGKYLIENTGKTMKEISYSLGYKYVNNFSSAFKKRFGKTASQWKDQLT